MRQKDIDRIAGILGREMQFATEHEVEGLRCAIGAIKADVGWAQPELDMTPLDEALLEESLAGDVIHHAHRYEFFSRVIEACCDSMHYYCQCGAAEPCNESHIVRGED